MGNEKPEDPNPDLNPDPNQRPEPSSAAVPLETKKGTEKGCPLLIIFCLINLINYIDRGAIASNGVNGSRKTCSKDGTCSSGSGIQGDFNMNIFEDGVLSSAFMVGLLVASPIFASSAKSFNPFRLIGVGLTVWTLAVAFCGFSFNFWSIAVCRMLVGGGEASFISLPLHSLMTMLQLPRTAWLGTFYMCIPTGVAVGYVYGGVISRFGWRWAFWVEAILMLPFAILGFVMKPLQLKGLTPAESKKALTAVDNGSEDQGGELSRTVEVADESSKPLGLTALTVFGKDMKVLLLEKSNADYMFGGVTAVCGILGSLAGGFVLDLFASSLLAALRFESHISKWSSNSFYHWQHWSEEYFALLPFASKAYMLFLAFFAMGELLVFATQAPVNFVCLHCVKPSLRPLSMAISTVSIHIFGDVPSSPLLGFSRSIFLAPCPRAECALRLRDDFLDDNAPNKCYFLQDHINNWRVTALILTSILFISAGLWFIGVFLNSVDRYNEDNEHPATAVEKSNSTPLLAEKTA
ncbi:UNVERIFIED_CONTAM: putative sphingolipid transporter spinster2 [Sesamum calycinum]|uniref:Sphingolipid transporter spinster2 n=1 Tax=Sesamum calycinum TaxID=2727403 RepID=A0AAW2PLA0_9LAMI